MRPKKVYLLNKENANMIFSEDIIKQIYPTLEEEDIVVEDRSFLLASKKLLKQKGREFINYKWDISICPNVYMEFGEHTIATEEQKEYEDLFTLTVRYGSEHEEIDKKVLEVIELKPFYIAQKSFEILKKED